MPSAEAPKLKFSCNHCTQVLVVKLSSAGKSGPCPNCRKMVVAPEVLNLPAGEISGKPPAERAAAGVAAQKGDAPVDCGSGKGTLVSAPGSEAGGKSEKGGPSDPAAKTVSPEEAAVVEKTAVPQSGKGEAAGEAAQSDEEKAEGLVPSAASTGG